MPMLRKDNETQVFAEFGVGVAHHATSEAMVAIQMGGLDILFKLDEAEFLYQQMQKAMREIRAAQPRIVLTDRIGTAK